MACHGTDGRAEGTGLNLAGMGATEFRTRLLEFKRGARPGTVMPEHAKGYSDTELERIAGYFATRSRGGK
jgi:cytochrome c553